jgi:hypothetical protein
VFAQGSPSAQRAGEQFDGPPSVEPPQPLNTEYLTQTAAPGSKQHAPEKPFGPSVQFWSVAPG